MARGRILIDTSILIDHVRKINKTSTVFYKEYTRHDYAISAVTEFEFRVGMNPKNQQFSEQLISAIPTLPFDSNCAQVAAQIYKSLKVVNQLISMADIFIGATDIAHNLPLLTLNVKHFERIPNIQLYRPAS